MSNKELSKARSGFQAAETSRPRLLACQVLGSTQPRGSECADGPGNRGRDPRPQVALRVNREWVCSTRGFCMFAGLSSWGELKLKRDRWLNLVEPMYTVQSLLCTTALKPGALKQRRLGVFHKSVVWARSGGTPGLRAPWCQLGSSGPGRPSERGLLSLTPRGSWCWLAGALAGA